MAEAVAVPDTLEVIAGEYLDFDLDFAGVIGTSDQIRMPRIVILNEASREEVTSAIAYGSVVLTGQVMSFTLDTSPLRRGTSYAASFTCVVSNLIVSPSPPIAGELIVVLPSEVTWDIGNTITVVLIIKVIY